MTHYRLSSDVREGDLVRFFHERGHTDALVRQEWTRGPLLSFRRITSHEVIRRAVETNDASAEVDDVEDVNFDDD